MMSGRLAPRSSVDDFDENLVAARAFEFHCFDRDLVIAQRPVRTFHDGRLDLHGGSRRCVWSAQSDALRLRQVCQPWILLLSGTMYFSLGISWWSLGRKGFLFAIRMNG
ncbi:hypothetical protein ATO4_16050 [Aurantimonas sp. 22II-16-19i]|nr:hypothetical protein ATO4_16050 [Aurantimonas sp. 22II-16-19i]